MSSVLYAPVLAISAVTNLSVEFSIIVFGLVCSIYCSIVSTSTFLFQIFLIPFIIQSYLSFECFYKKHTLYRCIQIIRNKYASFGRCVNKLHILKVKNNVQLM